jgi:Sigma-70, region 4
LAYSKLPPAEDLALLQDEIVRVLASTYECDELYKTIVELRLAECTEGEIAEKLGVSLATVKRRLRKIREAYWKNKAARVPVVLCDLQGLTHEKAARHLGWPVGTVKSRLARARELLRGRLCRRSLGLPARLMICAKGLGGAFRAVEVVLPCTLVESTVRAAAPIAAGQALAIGVISSRVAILIEEVLKTMVVTKLKLTSVFVLLIGAAGAAGVLAQQRSRSDASPAADQAQGPAASESRRAPEVDPARAPAPAYITEARAMILTRLEEEVAEARARLDRTLRKFRSPDNPAVVRARETLEALVQQLDRIDRVLVDVVETYPTMVDFSVGPSDSSHVGRGVVSGDFDNDGDLDIAVNNKHGAPAVLRHEAKAANHRSPQQALSSQGQQGDSQNNSPKQGRRRQAPRGEPHEDNGE